MPKPLLCVTVEATTAAELRHRRDAVTGADLVELRLDGVSNLDIAGALEGRRLPVIMTCRPTWEGGRFDGAEEERHRLLARAQALGAEYIDVEWQAGFFDLVGRRGGEGVIVSLHDFTGVPRDLEDRVRAMRQTGAEVIKVAVQARRLCDTLPLLDVAAGSRAVVLGMGPAGLPTRVLAARFGSAWTYAGDRPDLGQESPERMLQEYRFHAVSPATALYGLAGSPVAHSVSPAMHNAGFRSAGIDAVYLPLECADAHDFLEFARALSMEGASVTAPFKRDLYDRADEVDPVSRRVGALNTLRRDGGRFVGCNTDVAGFLAPLEGRAALGELRAAIVGTGGAARAVAVALASEGARIVVYGRDGRKAAEVARIGAGEARELPVRPGSWDMLVNTTPIGTYPAVQDSPMTGQPLDGRLVYDLVYNPAITRLLRDARASGCDTIGGLDMLVAQALLQFQWWTGHRPPSRLFRQAAERRLAEMNARPERSGSGAERSSAVRHEDATS
jgi:3-dehydroquinate dehydratase/shikimate dehydrogenase